MIPNTNLNFKNNCGIVGCDLDNQEAGPRLKQTNKQTNIYKFIVLTNYQNNNVQTKRLSF